MENGWDPGCRPCYDEEAIGKESLRQRYNQRLSGKDNVLEFIEISISNHCNLSCKMCNNMASSRWQSILDQNENLLRFDFSKNRTKAVSIDQLLDSMDLSNLKEIKYLGGEPFITPELYKLIEKLKTSIDLTKVKFRCNTNCTFFPSKWIPLLSDFKQIIIIFSLDGMDELCNYIRTGESWQTVSSVINQWMDLSKINNKFELAAHTTLQAYNLHQFDSIKKFVQDRKLNFFFKFIQEPSYLTLSCLPREYIDNLDLHDSMVKDTLSRIAFDLNNFRKFVEYTQEVDQILGTSLENIVPKLYEFIKTARR